MINLITLTLTLSRWEREPAPVLIDATSASCHGARMSAGLRHNAVAVCGQSAPVTPRKIRGIAAELIDEIRQRQLPWGANRVEKTPGEERAEQGKEDARGEALLAHAD